MSVKTIKGTICSSMVDSIYGIGSQAELWFVTEILLFVISLAEESFGEFCNFCLIFYYASNLLLKGIKILVWQ